VLVGSVVRPLASLRVSARAIASGNLEARAKVAGPEEVASLAHDFNTMTQTLLDQTAQTKESEKRFRNVLDVSRDFIYKIDLQTGTYDYASPSVLQLTGFTPEEVVAMGLGGVAERIHPEDSSRLTEEIEDLTKDWNEGQRSAISEYRWKRKNGEYRWFSDNSVFVRYSNEQPPALIGAIRDITAQKQAEEALRESEERFRSIFESIQDVFYRTDGEGIITEISPSVERFGYTREQLVGTQVLEVYGDPEERAGLLKAVLEQGEVTDHEIRLKTGDGRLVSTSVSAHLLRGPDGTLSGVEGTLRDISDRKAAAEALREQARRDPLTGVLNHGAIVDEMRSLISNGEQAAVWAVAMIDVNGLKVANDTYGHQVGDAVLVAVAAALSRDDAVVGRYGGDEFVAILPSADRNAAEYYLNEVMDALAHVTVGDPETGASISVGASIGLAMYPEDGGTIADLIKFSDAAMYAAKRQRPFRRPSSRRPRIGRKAA
jgi:diguanylate cyclase (GGDEF)-like protein/PAS domain S-box-containing protein